MSLAKFALIVVTVGVGGAAAVRRVLIPATERFDARQTIDDPPEKEQAGD